VQAFNVWCMELSFRLIPDIWAVQLLYTIFSNYDLYMWWSEPAVCFSAAMGRNRKDSTGTNVVDHYRKQIGRKYIIALHAWIMRLPVLHSLNILSVYAKEFVKLDVKQEAMFHSQCKVKIECVHNLLCQRGYCSITSSSKNKQINLKHFVKYSIWLYIINVQYSFLSFLRLQIQAQ